jgi:AraC-like DNA-binding protein
VRRADDDPVDELVRRDAFQRSSVELAVKAGDAISGKVGDHGVAFLLAQRSQRNAVYFAERVSSLARRRFGLTVHFGASGPSRSGELNRSYQAALGAAEMALTQNKKLVTAETSSSRRFFPFFRLRDEMARAAREQPGRLPVQFDRYIEAVSALYGHRLEPARAELAICVERVADVLLHAGALDQRGALAIRERLDRSSTAAGTLAELFASYRTAILDLSTAAERPVAARHDRGLRGALEYVEKHYTESISLETVARASGFARTYFSELFKELQGTTFQRYLVGLRIERAKKLLTGTDLSVTRVAELSGHGSAAYLCRVFKRIVGATPLEYRGGIAPHRMRHGRRSQTDPSVFQR